MTIKMAKASEADLRMAMELTTALEALERYSIFPEALTSNNSEQSRPFDIDDHDQCHEALAYLLNLVGKASLMRVVWGLAVLLDPKNRAVDPDADTLEHPPEIIAARTLRPLAEFHEDMGAVLWHTLPIVEPPWCGQPDDSDWPGYHTHFTKLLVPEAPAAGGNPA